MNADHCDVVTVGVTVGAGEALMGDPKDRKIVVRCTAAEYEAWRAVAEAGERTVAQWVRYHLNRAAKQIGGGS